MIFQSVLLLIYVTLAKPFADPVLNRLEVFNEFSILIASYHLILFTDYVSGFDDTLEFQYFSGWSMIAISTFNITINMVVMVYATLKRIRRNMLKWRW